MRQTSINGRPARPGDLLDVSASDARLLLNMGKAVAVAVAAPAPAPDPDPEPAAHQAATPRKPRTRKG